MTASPHPTVADLRRALGRYDAETTPGVCDTGRYRMAYVAWGDPHDRPVVFVHGMSDVPRSFAMVMERLVDAGYRCVGYDLPHGRGDGANLGMYRHPHFAADLVALLDHLGYPRADVVGSSFGSTIAQRAAAIYPDRLRRIVLQGGFARRPLRRLERGLVRVGRYWPWRMGELILHETVMLRYEGGQFEGCPPEVQRFLISNSGRTPCRASALRTLIIDTLDLRPLFPKIPHPVLMIGGDRDGLVPKEYELEVANGLKDVRRVEFRPCGHYPQYTMPGPMAAEILGHLG